MKAVTLTFACLTALATQAHASSPDAWAAFDKAVLASCTKASGLANAKPVGNAAQFDDRVGYTALLLQGQYPQNGLCDRVGLHTSKLTPLSVNSHFPDRVMGL
jgi:hypothetical protein